MNMHEEYLHLCERWPGGLTALLQGFSSTDLRKDTGHPTSFTPRQLKSC